MQTVPALVHGIASCLVPDRRLNYASAMDEASWIQDSGWTLAVVVAGMLVFELGRRWYRRRVAAKLADALLSDVIKGKDAFRR